MCIENEAAKWELKRLTLWKSGFDFDFYQKFQCKQVIACLPAWKSEWLYCTVQTASYASRFNDLIITILFTEAKMDHEVGLEQIYCTVHYIGEFTKMKKGFSFV